MKKVLVIEDDNNIRENTAEILELANYQVYTAENGKAGLQTALVNKPDLILCDIMMPELDGYGVLHVLTKHPELQNVPFIFLTAKTERSEIRKGMSLGADDYITKPFDSTDLLEAVEGRLKKSEKISHKTFVGIEGLNDLITVAGSDQLLNDFVKGRHVDKYKKKQRVYSEGNHPLRLYYVESGRVKISKRNDDGKELIIKLVNEGEFFGYHALLENSVYKDAADALVDSEIAIIPVKEFEDLLYSNLTVAKKFIKLLAMDVAEKEEQLVRIAYNSLRKKVADAILTVQKRNTDNSNIDFSVTRETLAAIAGTTPESLTRTLTDFKDEKLIEIDNRKITILNFYKLENMVN